MATTNTNSDDFDVSEQNRLDKRDVRALTECMTVLAEGGSMFTVVGQNGGTYTCDAKHGRCECPDMEHNLPDGDREECKHIARVRFATGEKPIPGHINMDKVDDLLGEQLPNSQPRIAMADGGQLFVEDRHEMITEDIDGGHLVWEDSEGTVGRDLVGFAAVDDWDAVRSELIRRGIGVGAIHHKEVFEPAEVGL